MSTVSARVSLRNGQLEGIVGERDGDLVEHLAVSAGDLFAADTVCWELVFGHLGGTAGTSGFHEFVLISEGHVYVVQRSPDTRSALIGIADRDGSIGLAISDARQDFKKL